MELLKDQYKHDIHINKIYVFQPEQSPPLYFYDEWVQLEIPTARGSAEPSGRLRFNLHWIHSRRMFLQDILRIQDAGLDEYQQERQQLSFQLENMRKPFGFMQAYYAQEKVLQKEPSQNEGGFQHSQRAQEVLRQFDELQGKALVVEKQAQVKFDQLTTQVASRIGLREIPWFKLTLILTALYAVTTLLCLFQRLDYLNVPICLAACYLLYNLHTLKQNTFRWLTLAVFLSLIYDLVWFILKNPESANLGYGRFALFMTYISFFVRLAMGMVYWKDSLDFDSIMLGKKVDVAIRTMILNATQQQQQV